MTDAPDPRALRDAFGCFMTGVTVVTTMAEGRPLGFTANSFTSVSLDPPLLLVSIANRSGNLAAFTTGPGFAVNILSEAQKDLSARFAKPLEDRFAGVYWRQGPAGSPLLAGVSAWFDCALDRAIPAGDHTLLIGRIDAFEALAAPGLGYSRGAYVTAAATAAHLPAGPDVIVSAVIEAAGQVLLVDDGRGGLSVPMARVGRDGVQAALAGLLTRHGVTAGAGTIYAVYEDARLGTQHIALRCPAEPGQPLGGAYVELSRDGVADVTDPALRIMLQRLAEEARLGAYGIYFGTQDAGHVQRLSEGPTE
jgi:flavin-dependent trigonelline monooxygenase, reductase component